MLSDLQCWDCYAMRVLAGLGDRGACPRHATPAQREAAASSIREMRLRDNPFTRALSRRV